MTGKSSTNLSRTGRLALVAAARLGSAVGALGMAGAALAAGPIAVDLSTSTGAVKHGATGFLYGLGSDGVPTDTMLDGLSHLDVLAQKAPDGLQHPTGDALLVAPQWKRNGGGDVQIYVQDVYRDWPYERLGLSDYLEKVRTIASKVKASPNRSSFVYVPFNEPNWIWYGGDLSGLENDWETVYKAIRSIDPQARIAGPNYSEYVADDYRAFMTFAKEHNVLPDVTSWHELGDYAGWYDHYDDYRRIEKDLGIAARPISINEYGRSGDDLWIPGNLLQLMARFENSKVSGSLAYWQPAGTLDEQVTENNRATGTWWLYHWYGLMSGNTVKVTLADRNQPTQAIAAYDATKNQARILFGGNGDANGTFDTTLSVAGLGGTRLAGRAHVTVWGVDATGPAVSSGPYVVADQDVTSGGGSFALPLQNLKGGSAYYAVLTPGTGTSSADPSRYEAEYARLEGGAAISYGQYPGYSATGYVQGFTGSSTAAGSFFVNAPDNGFYNATIRYSAGPLSGAPTGRTVKLALNQGGGRALLLPGTASWNDWASKTVRLYLPAGINKIRLAAYTSDDSDAIHLDYLQLARTTGPETTYEAEASGNSLLGAASVSSDSNASGGRFVGFIGNGPDNVLQFNNVSVPNAGEYTLVFRYSQAEVAGGNAYQIVDRFADVAVNGTAPVRLAFANTRDWSKFWTASVRVTLKAGANTVRVGNVSGWAPNIDSMTVAPTSN